MKIVYIASSGIPSRYANSIHVVKMCQAFKQNGIDIILIVPQFANERSDNDIFKFYGLRHRFEIINILYKNRLDRIIKFPYRAVKLAISKKADLIYSRNFYVSPWVSHFKIPYILEVHQPPGSFARKLYLKWAVHSKYLQFLVSITESLKRWYVKWGIPEDRIVTLPDAVDIERFPKPQFFKKCSLEKIRIGYSGHLYKGRGIDLILNLAERMKKALFIIIGGYESDIKHWQDFAENRKIKNVKFTGFVQNNRLPQQLNKIDILLLPYGRKVEINAMNTNTVKFMSPLKMFEYMATGKPIIASDLPVLREILKDKSNCMLVECDNVSKWQKALEFLIKNPGFAVKIGRRAREEAEKKYTWNIRARKILQKI